MTKMTKKSTKGIITSVVTFIMASVLVLAGFGIGWAVKHKPGKGEPAINPVAWSVDVYEGGDPDTTNWLSGTSFANRGNMAYTINSAESFLKFVEIVNSDVAAEYKYLQIVKARHSVHSKAYLMVDITQSAMQLLTAMVCLDIQKMQQSVTLAYTIAQSIARQNM